MTVATSTKYPTKIFEFISLDHQRGKLLHSHAFLRIKCTGAAYLHSELQPVAERRHSADIRVMTGIG